MDNFWKDISLRQNMLNEFGNSTGKCYMFYSFKENTFYFSDNIFHITGTAGKTVYSLEQWYHIIYEADRNRLLKGHLDMFHPTEDHYGFNYRLHNAYGQLIWVNNKGSCTFDESGNPDYFLGTLMTWDIHKTNDDNTHTTLLETLRNIHRQRQDGYLLMIGVNDLRKINLKYGREFGDGILGELMDTMRRANPHFSKIFRISGNTFCILALEADRKAVESYFLTVQENMRPQCTISGGCVALQEYQVTESDTLLHYAENTLEKARSEGNTQLSFFNPEDYERTLSVLELQMDLETAVEEGFNGFSLHYQPKVTSETFSLAGAEALLRFTSPRRGMISPSEFIPVLEQSGLIVPVGLWVLRSALEQCRLWRKQCPDFKVSVNMSYVQLSCPDIQTKVLSVLQQTGLSGDALIIEVTESMELREYTYLNTIFSAWKKEGIEISVDDFGTGYSSLSWLKQLSIDGIKIDRCFVNGIPHSAYNLRLLSNIIELASSGYLKVCCEGVETAEELAVLETLRPTLYQGYFFSEPVAPENFCPEKMQQLIHSRSCHQKSLPSPKAAGVSDQLSLEHAILETTEDAISLCDVCTHEIYYLNPAARRIFGVWNYEGLKCYRVLRGKDTPCDFCPNATLRHDTFSIREDNNPYCDRHFLMKDKLLDVDGRTLRLQIAMDITKREYMGKQTKERLEFANRITDYVDILSRQKNWCRAVEFALAAMGKFYNADRAYLFERTPEQTNYWANTFEWCAPGVTPQQENLQRVPPAGIERWLKIFGNDETVILYNLDPLQEKSPLEWEILHSQGIQRVIAVPLMSGGSVAAFIGVDNPRYAIHDDSQARVLASFLTARFRRERREWQLTLPDPLSE